MNRNGTGHFHCSVKNGKRSSGKNAVNSAAYRAGEKLHDEMHNQNFDYTRKSNVLYSEILLPENADKKYSDRGVLWNEVEKLESRKDARLYREFEISLPVGVDFETQKNIALDYAKYLNTQGMICDVNIHETIKKVDGNEIRNPHAHIVCPVRHLDGNGQLKLKTDKKTLVLDKDNKPIPILDKNGNQVISKRTHQPRFKTLYENSWNNKDNVEKWRSQLADITNSHIRKYNEINHENIPEVNSKSYERQGIKDIPVKRIPRTIYQLNQRSIFKEQASKYFSERKQIQDFNRAHHDIAKLTSDIDILIAEARSNILDSQLAHMYDDILSKHLNPEPEPETARAAAAAVLDPLQPARTPQGARQAETEPPRPASRTGLSDETLNSLKKFRFDSHIIESPARTPAGAERTLDAETDFRKLKAEIMLKTALKTPAPQLTAQEREINAVLSGNPENNVLGWSDEMLKSMYKKYSTAANQRDCYHGSPKTKSGRVLFLCRNEWNQRNKERHRIELLNARRESAGLPLMAVDKIRGVSESIQR